MDREDAGPPARVERWHVGKEIPLTLVFLIIVQTVGFIFWLASLSNKVDRAIEALQEFKGERYAKEDARRDFRLVEQLNDAQNIRLEDHERRIRDLEAAVRSRR